VPRTPINLDELEELNPEPQVYIVAGRELVLKELSHVQFYRAEATAERMQRRITAKDFAVGELEDQTVRLLMELYEPHNGWLAEEDDRAHAHDVEQWRERHPDGRPSGEPAEPDPMPLRRDYCGTWFNRLSQPKIVHLTAEAFRFNQQSIADAQAGMLVDLPAGVSDSELPPVLAAARQAAMARRSTGANSTGS